jgi:protein arginine N-methyltransferase 5
MIPSSYTSFIAPLSSQKLFDEASAYKDLVHLETPYVVQFRQTFEIADAKPLWTFHHPNRGKKETQGIHMIVFDLFRKRSF